MKKNVLGFILLAIAFIVLILGLVMLKTRFNNYAIIAYALAAVVGFVGLYYIITNSNPKTAYESAVRGVLNTYDSVLVQSNKVPNLDGRNIVYIGTIDDLIDAQLEIRKPICYVKQSESCSFILLDDKEAFVHIMKLSPEVLSPLEIEIKENDLKVKNQDEMDAEMLREIEKTTIVKLSNHKSYKVSPIRKKKEEEKVEDKVEEIVEEPEEVNKEVKEEPYFEEPLIRKEENNDTEEVLDDKKEENNDTEEVLDDKKEEKEDDIEVLF